MGRSRYLWFRPQFHDRWLTEPGRVVRPLVDDTHVRLWLHRPTADRIGRRRDVGDELNLLWRVTVEPDHTTFGPEFERHSVTTFEVDEHPFRPKTSDSRRRPRNARAPSDGRFG
jgi:hypothetical protein